MHIEDNTNHLSVSVSNVWNYCDEKVIVSNLFTKHIAADHVTGSLPHAVSSWNWQMVQKQLNKPHLLIWKL